MNSGRSSLNPYAASYVPLYVREANDKVKDSKITSEASKGGDETTPSKPPSEGHETIKQTKLCGESSLDYNTIHGVAELLGADDFTQMGRQNAGYHGSWSQNPGDIAEKYYVDEGHEMDLAYLAITFPGISDQSLLDVYSANGGDLEASIEMLNQLESSVVDISQHLPDTLGIGDVPESGASAEGPSSKLKQLSGEASGSSSGSSKSA